MNICWKAGINLKGLLIVNEFLNTNKFNEIHNWLLDSAGKNDIEMMLCSNAQILIDIAGPPCERLADFILFWDKDVKLALYLEELGYPVYNCSRAIEVCDDKALTHLTLMNKGIPMPRTVIAPKTFDNIGYTNYHFLDEVEKRLGFPMVIKECFGSFGQQVYLVHTTEEARVRMNAIGAKPMLFQEFLQTSFGRDVRLQVVGGEVIASMYRYSENGDFRANLSIGGKMLPYEPTEKQKELAIRCCEIIGLDFAGVDLLYGEGEEPIVCEVNSNAHFKNIFDCTGVNAADAIMEYIRNKECEGKW
jgi:RimK family alpha-L-glutamate ligase